MDRITTLDTSASTSSPHATRLPESRIQPSPLLRLELRDLSLPGTHDFLLSFLGSVDLSFAVDTVLNLLYSPNPSTPPTWPSTRSITLVIRSMPGVAYTTALDLDADHKEIHLSAEYVAGITPSTRRRDELLGVVVHEMVHCWQYNAKGTAPGGLIEGIADWVRLRAGYAAPHWKREPPERWDAGYQNTGYFLEWLEQTREDGLVVKLNQRLREEKYDEDKFWTALCGEKVGVLFAKYCASLKLPKDTGQN